MRGNGAEEGLAIAKVQRSTDKKMAIVGAAPRSPSGDSPDFEQPLLHAHGGLLAGKDPAAPHDQEAQCSPQDGGATSLRTGFNGLNALSGESHPQLQ